MADTTEKTCFYKLVRRHFKMSAHVSSLVLVTILFHNFGIDSANTICLLQVSLDTTHLGYLTSDTLTLCQKTNVNLTK